MKCFLPALLFAIPLFHSNIIKADDVIIPYGKNYSVGPVWKFIGGGTSLDAVSWKGLAYAEPGWIITNKTAFGYGSGIPLVNTTIPGNATSGGGGISGSRYPTIYFRNTVYIVDPSYYTNFQVNAKFDDAIVIWVNGVEAFRNNISVNPTYATLATASIAGNGGTVSTGTINTSLFVSGNNIIAVEVHQRSTANNTDGNDFFFDMELRGLNANLTRGPYMQVANETGVTFRWRTSVASDSKITWGPSFGNYTNIVSDATSTTEHILRVTGLTADTKYYYTIGTTSQVISAANSNFFHTAPASNSNRKFKIVAIGDCGTAATMQIDVKNSFLNYMGGVDVDAMITLGDNAYTTGLDAEFQTNFFDIYKDDLLRYNKLYMAPGNHDYGNSQTNSGVRNNAYYNSFSAPTAAECGGVASGTEAYYSYDIGNIHFLSLDSYGKEDGNTTRMYDTLGAQVTWIKSDLAANSKRWVVAYFHHPPYTKGSHTSDTEQELVDIRERFIRILERYGVDMVLCGHSHGYERSYLLKGLYRTPANPVMDSSFKFIYHTATGNNQNGKYDGTANSCAYSYNSGKYNHGSMYVVAGSAGQVSGSTAGYPHDAMYYSNVVNGGLFYFETDSNRLDAKFISYNAVGDPTPLLRDSFTIFKDVNKAQDIVVNQNTSLNLVASWRGSYLWPNNGSANTQAVFINTSVIGSSNYIVQDANNCLKDSFHVVITPVLPVTIHSFSVSLNKDIVLLNWVTDQEINNELFTIDRSIDGYSFTLLGTLNGAGTSSVSNEYHLYDLHPLDGVNYYRLSQTNRDGERKIIEIKKIIYINKKICKATIVNNGSGTMRISVQNGNSGSLEIKIVDILGREIMTKSLPVESGNFNQDIQLRKGIYVIMLVNNSEKIMCTKFIAD